MRLRTFYEVASVIYICLLLCPQAARAQDEPAKPDEQDKPDTSNTTKKVGRTLICSDGLVLNVWRPLEDLSATEVYIRGAVYMLAMIYIFLGVSILADRFMEAIEVITSSERQVVVQDKNGDRQVIPMRVWNETVANLTLMALGSSAPEILLSIVELFQKDFEAGDLGPGTIVGSAAYNLFIIIAICMVVIPTGQVRRIKHLRVFIVTAAWSVFAYIWMYAVLVMISPGKVDIWEAVLTFIFFPGCVIHGYIAERRLLCYKYLVTSYSTNNRGTVVRRTRVTAVDEGGGDDEGPVRSSVKVEADTSEVRDFEETRLEYISNLKELHKKYPQYELEQLQAMALENIIKDGPKSRAYYRIEATRKMVGSGNLLRKAKDRAVVDINEIKSQMYKKDLNMEEADTLVRVYFEPSHYTVMESCGEFIVTVMRRGDLSYTTTVAYHTEDGSAKAGSDYVAQDGVLSFLPGIEEQTFKVAIIDDDIYELDEHFYIHLSNPSQPAVLAVPKVATVMILDDDHCGVVGFDEDTIQIPETAGTYPLKVRRFSGAKGKIIVRYQTEEHTALQGKQFNATTGELTFYPGEIEKFIPLEVIHEHSYEKDVMFYVFLEKPFIAPDEPYLKVIEGIEKKPAAQRRDTEKLTLQGRPKLSSISRVEVHITESEEFKLTVDKLVKTANASLLIGTTSWKEQFIDALTVAAGDDGDMDDDDDDDEEVDEEYDDIGTPGAMDYVMHFLTVLWKLAFAVVPPSKIYDGYLCFAVSIVGIGIVTAVLGDVASHFGCTLGVVDSVTAIVFVACGTSLPDTFASVIAAQGEKTADNSVGNVTGSNAVNVFLGVGIAWSIASVYHSSHGGVFRADPGTLGFSTAVFLVEAAMAIALLLYRRKKAIGGELGGPDREKWMHASFLVVLWIVYIVLSVLDAYEVI